VYNDFTSDNNGYVTIHLYNTTDMVEV